MDKDVEEVLSRGVGVLIDPDGAFKEKLLKKARGEYDRDIVIKLGVDPTRPDIHLGHAVVLRRLRQFQDLGCKVIFLVGDYTAQIGDPSGKSKVRPEVEQAEVAKNAETYINQIGKILRTDDPKLFSWIRNSDWFMNITDINLPDDADVSMDVTVDGKVIKNVLPPNSFMAKAIAFEKTRMQITSVGLKENIIVVTLASFLWFLKHITHSRLIERDMFQDRIKSGEELYMHEMMYPVLQGVDSFAIAKVYGSCDLEMGGTDQTFNMLVGRDIMKANNLPPQGVLAMDIIPGTDGKEKMSKSLDNYIAITDAPSDMYGKVMSIPDSAMSEYFSLATYTPLPEVKDIEEKLASGKLHPKDTKMRLAREITAIYHGETAAKKAEADFTETFSKGGLPEDIQTVKTSKGEKIVDILLSQNLIESKSEWRRLVDEGAVTNVETGDKISSPDQAIENSATLKVGKRRFIKIEVL